MQLSTQSNSGLLTDVVKIKLSKLEIALFDGDLVYWPSFWDDVY